MKKPTDNNARKTTRSYMKYSGIAYQLTAILLISIFGGQWLDSYFELEQAYFTAGLSFVLVIGYLYKLVIDLSKPEE